jgi:membrane protease YdiL (CAAX protease family)
MHHPPRTPRVLWLLTKVAAARLLRFSAMQQQRRRIKATQQRSTRGASAPRRRATPPKRMDGTTWMLVAFLPLFLLQALMMTAEGSRTMASECKRHVLVERAIRAAPERESRTVTGDPTSPSDAEDAPVRLGGRAMPPKTLTRLFFGGEFPGLDGRPRDLYLRSMAVLMTGLALAMFVLAFGGAHATLAGGSWTWQWLMTFPVPTRSLVLARAAEYALIQASPWFFLAPLGFQVLRTLGWTILGAASLAILATLILNAITGSLRLFVETWLRLRYSLRTLRAIAGICAVIAVVLLGLCATVFLRGGLSGWLIDFADALPAGTTWLPTALPIAIVEHGLHGVLAGGAIAAGVFVIVTFGTARLLSGGVMRSGGVDSGARDREGRWRKGRAMDVYKKDLALLRRDHHFLAQTLVVPAVMIAMQLLLNPRLGTAEGRAIAMFGYGIGLFSLLGGGFQSLAIEGRALWMLFTFPTPVGRVLAHKARIWAAIAIGFGWIAVGLRVFGGAAITASELVRALAMVAVGLFCAAHLAVGISVIGATPRGEEVSRQPKARHVYLFFALASSWFAVLGAETVTQTVTAIAVVVTLTFAVWQRACARLPWLLDPSEEPRDRVLLFDGAAALFLFFVIQLLGGLLLQVAEIDGIAWGGMTLVFSIAGAVAILVMTGALAARGADVRGELGLESTRLSQRWHTAIGLSILGGLALGGLALGYSLLVRHMEWFELPTMILTDRTWIMLLGVLAAPIVEEVLFRGLLLAGLRSSFSDRTAVLASASLFAVVHPAQSWLPVFLVGVFTAWLRIRCGHLLPAMVTHAVYNAFVITAS